MLSKEAVPLKFPDFSIQTTILKLLSFFSCFRNQNFQLVCENSKILPSFTFFYAVKHSKFIILPFFRKNLAES